MNIAIATDFCSPWVGGPATFIDNFSAYLAAEGHRVDIIAPSATGSASVEHVGGVTVWREPSIPMPFGYGVRATFLVRRIARRLRHLRPDIVQIHHPFPLGFGAMRAARQYGLPVVAVNHTIPECSLYGIRHSPIYPFAVGAFRRYLVSFLSGADAICTPSQTAASLLRGMGINQAVEVISNGIDVSRFRPHENKQAARQALGLPNKRTVLYTGRLDAEKDMTTWLLAGEKLVQTTDAHLVVGGEGADKPRLLRMVADMGLQPHVTFPGYVPVDRLPTLYQAADVYFITSAVELQSITTLEALATGLPVVAARARALPELVEDGSNGYLARPGDVESFARALTTLIECPEHAREMGAVGRKLAELHSFQVVVKRHEALLERTAFRRSSAGAA